jgi:hypothetical protein
VTTPWRDAEVRPPYAEPRRHLAVALREKRCSALGKLARGAYRSAAQSADDVMAGDITLSVRLWKRPRVRQGGCCGGR